MDSAIVLHWLAKGLMAALAVGLIFLGYSLLRQYRLHRPYWFGPPSGTERSNRSGDKGDKEQGDRGI